MNPVEHEAVTKSEAETHALGERLGRRLHAGDVVTLHGELGAGKTCLVRGIVAGAGGDAARVSSPTFVLMNIYPPARAGAPPIAHIDAYRLGPGDDLEAIGWDRVSDGAHIILIEWAERIGHALPEERTEVRIGHAGEHERSIIITPPPGRSIAL